MNNNFKSYVDIFRELNRVGGVEGLYQNLQQESGFITRVEHDGDPRDNTTTNIYYGSEHIKSFPLGAYTGKDIKGISPYYMGDVKKEINKRIEKLSQLISAEKNRKTFKKYEEKCNLYSNANYVLGNLISAHEFVCNAKKKQEPVK
ncbi:MAG: hypothetical protein FWD32_00265 [Firmicutes bacterium]|nr:hypothetical protein [Bacillota bacterium]